MTAIAGKIDWSARGRARVYLATLLGTLFCIAVSITFDSYDMETGTWRLTSAWFNNILIPLILAPPLFYLLLSKLRELAIAHGELMQLASTDGLTSCLNRRAFTAMVEGYLTRVAEDQTRSKGAMLVVDVDNFKRVNDNFGHDTGDTALRLIADKIRASVREIDLVGRLGGEEFGVFLPGVTAQRTAGVAERIRASVHTAHFAPNGQPYTLSVSIGGAAFDRGTTFTSLYKTADEHLFIAKRNGRNRVDITDVEAPPAAEAILVH